MRMSKRSRLEVAFDGVSVLDELLHAQHVPSDFREAGIRPDLRMALQDVASQDGRIAAHEGDGFRIIARKCLRKLDVIPRPFLRQG